MGNQEIKNAVLKVVTSHSGGIKFAELLSILIQDYSYKGTGIELESVCNDMQDMKVHVLEYTWLDCNRNKLFVYTF